MRAMRCFLAICLMAFVYYAGAQKTDGNWYGIGLLQTSQTYNDYLSELVLTQKGKNVSGTLHYYFKDSLVKTNISGTYDAGTRRLTIRPFSMIYYLSPSARNSIDCFMSGSFLLTVSKTESALHGILRPDNDHKYTVPAITLKLVKSSDTMNWVRTDEPEIEPAPDTTAVVSVAVPAAPLETPEELKLSKREKIFTRELEVAEKKLRLELYDNGEIDYDSVSLYLNNKLILPKRKLDHRALRLTIELDPAIEDNELSMFAENLGMIPPNTAALIIWDGTTRYEAILTSDLNKSATIRLKRKKE